ncbi:MAG: hypothetical protein ABGZ35_25830, partial [Planctomycetaceae bacterium]
MIESPELRAVDAAVSLLRIALCAYRIKVANPNSDIANCAAKVVNHASEAIPMPDISVTLNHVRVGWIERDSFTDCPAEEFEQRLQELDEYRSILRDYCRRHDYPQKNDAVTKNFQLLTNSFLKEYFTQKPTPGGADERQVRKSLVESLKSDDAGGKLFYGADKLVQCMFAGLRLTTELQCLKHLLDDGQTNGCLATFFETTMKEMHDEMTEFMQKWPEEVKSKATFRNRARIRSAVAAQQVLRDQFTLIWKSHADSISDFCTRLAGENQRIAGLIESHTKLALGLIPQCFSETANKPPPYWQRFTHEIDENLLDRSRDGILLARKLPMPVFQSSFVKALSVLLLGLNRVCEDGSLLERLVYLSLGLAVILGFIALKLIGHAMHHYGLDQAWFGFSSEVSIGVSLGVIAVTLALTTVASLIKSRKDDATADV